MSKKVIAERQQRFSHD